MHQSKATLVNYIKSAVLKERTTQRDAIMQKPPYESMSGVCQKHNNDSVVMWEEIMWSEKVSHYSEGYVAHTKYHIYSDADILLCSMI